MKIRSFFAGLIMAMAALVGCELVEQLGMPDVTLGATELEFTQDAGTQDMTFTATREWKVEYDADWIAVTPERGQGSNDAQTVSVAVTANNGGNRSAKVTVTIGLESKAFTVNQAGPGGDNGAPSVGGDVVYSNDFDKEEATNTYGSGKSWPYLDQFDGWMNQAGSGAAGVTFAYEGMSARANSTSDSNYSDYEGSGKNNMFFGKNAYLATYDIALGDNVNFALSFGTEKFDGNNKTAKFDPAEFHVWLSNDGKKWVELAYTFAGTEAGRWNVASTEFSVPAGTANLSVCVSADAASVYRMDDFKIVAIDKAGTAVDFSKGVEKDFAEGSGDNGSSDPGTEAPGKPASLTKVTVAEFKTKEVSETDWYELTGKITEIQKEDWGNFVIEDETGSVLIYGMTSKWVGSNDKSFSQLGLKVGDTVTLGTLRSEYQGTPQGGGNKIPAYYISHVAGEGGDDAGDTGDDNTGVEKPASLTKVTVAEFKTKEVSETDWYELTGKITEIQKEDWGNFVIEDETGSVLIYGMTSKWVGSNDKSFSQLGLKVGDTVTLGTLRGEYNGTPQGGGNKIPAYYISHVAGDGGDDAGDSGDDNTGEAGEYDPQGITWTLGEKAYDKTSGNNAQTGTVNGVAVNDMLKLGTGSLTGNATLHIPAGTKKVGFYLIAWKDKTATVKASVDGKEVASITPKANAGATGNPPYTITVTSDDYYEIEVNASEAIDVKVETTDKANGRVIFIGLKAITE